MRDTLGSAADSIENALNRAAVAFAVYAIGDSGFAYVTKVEMFRASGDPEPPPDRFPNDVRTPAGEDNFLEFLLSRFRARPGYYRVVAIVVTSRPLAVAPVGISAVEALELANGGMATLPPALRARVVTGLECVAFVYEFQRLSASDSIVTQRIGPLAPARTHLSKAGLWTAEQLQP